MSRLYSDLNWIWPLLSPPADYEEEYAIYRDLLIANGCHREGHVLHLGSGGGSIDWWMKQDFDVTGVDISPNMIERAKATNAEVIYHQGDMREVRLDEKFDGVFIHDAIAYMTTQEDLIKVYKTAAAHIKPSGAIVSAPEQLREQFIQNQVKSQTHRKDLTSVTTIEETFDPDPTDNEFECNFIFIVRDGPKTTIEHDKHTMGIHTLDQFKEAAKAANLDLKPNKYKLSDLDEDYIVLSGTA